MLDTITNYITTQTTQLFSYDRWSASIKHAYANEPHHIIVETVCIAVILLLLIKQSYDPRKRDKINKLPVTVQNELIDTWIPQPLVPQYTADRVIHTVDSIADRIVTIDNKQYLNFSSYNVLSMVQNEQVKQICIAAIDKYGVGSCGPRGFYGTFDVHIALEKHLADWFQGAQAILYSDNIACISSVIPAFSKRGDIIVCDEAVNYGIQQGILLSRSHVKFYKHNDMADLERVLQQVVNEQKGKKLVRRFIITEGISAYYGDIAPLNEIVALRNKYKFRIILDDCLGIGVLGATGRGTIEHHNIPLSEIELLCGTLDTVFASVGGFAVSSTEYVIDHQRLTGTGYVFSAASPPYTAAAASKALEILQSNPSLLTDLRSKSVYIHKALSSIDGTTLNGSEYSPLVYIRLQPSYGTANDITIIDNVIIQLLELGIAATAPDYVPFERRTPAAAVRLVVCIHHTYDDIDKAVQACKQAFQTQIQKFNSK